MGISPLGNLQPLLGDPHKKYSFLHAPSCLFIKRSFGGGIIVFSGIFSGFLMIDYAKKHKVSGIKKWVGLKMEGKGREGKGREGKREGPA